MSDFQTLKNRVILASFASTGLGVLLLFTPVKAVSNWVIAGSIGFLVAGNAIVDKAEKLHDKQASKVARELQNLTNELADNRKLSADRIEILECELTSKKAELVISYTNNHQITQNALQLKATISKLQTELMTAKNQLSEAKDINSSTAVEVLQDSFVEFKSQISALTAMLAKKYPDLGNDWASVEEEYQKQATELTNQIRVVSDQSSSEELISMALAVQYEILYRGSMLKVKAYKSVVTHLATQLIDVMPIDEHSAAIEELNQTWQVKTQAIKQEYHQYFEAIKAEFSEVADTVTTAYREDFNSIITEGMSQAEQIEALQLELHRLTRKLEELSKPHRFPGLTEQARVGNAIIDYYQRLGYTLDAIDWVSNETGYKLLFHHTRNGSRFISTDLLNDGDLPEKLKEVSAALNTPKFEQSDRGGHVFLEVQTRKPEKKTLSLEDIRRLIEPSNRFGDVVRRYHESKPTLRVMTRTGGGKGIAVKNLLHNYVHNFEGYEIWLSDPQHGSFEDYWNIPKIAKNPSEASKSLELFINEFLARKDGNSTNADIPVIACFDECDKTFDKKQKQGIAQVWTEIRHRKMKLILIGQSSEVGKNGWTWDEMNNCSLLFIGDAVGTAIKHADDMGWSSEMKTKIPSIYQKVSDWMNEANKDLPAKNHYRLGLLIDGMRFDFVEIPPALDGSFDNNKSWLVERSWQSKYSQATSVNTLFASEHPASIQEMQGSLEALKIGASQMASSRYIGVGCPKCNQGELVKVKKNRSTYLYQCGGCQKWTSENLLSEDRGIRKSVSEVEDLPF